MKSIFDNIVDNFHLKGIAKYIFVGFIVLILFLCFNFFSSFFTKENKSKKDIVFSLNGSKVVTLFINSSFVDSGFVATDSNGSDVSSSVIVTGSVDTTKPGIYDVTYKLVIEGVTRELSRTYVVVDSKKSYINLLGDETIFLIVGEKYLEPGYVAFDYNGVPGNVVVDGVVNVNKIGVYKILYSFVDSEGVKQSVSRTVSVNIALPTDLKFILNGEDSLQLFLNSFYVEEGYSAIDGIDGDITNKVIVEGDINTSKPGEYVLTYHIVNSSGIEKELTRRITVLEREIGDLKLVLNGSETMELYVGDIFSDPFVSAFDSYEGNITDRVVVSGSVNASIPGEYILEYLVKNVDGIEKKVSRRVIVFDNLKLTGNYSPTQMVNTTVLINVRVDSDNYDYTILPNGSKTASKSINYMVSKNGTYVFTAYDVNKKVVKKEFVINNIDNVLPTGLCAASVYKDHTDVVVSNVSEDNCSFQYVLDGQSSGYLYSTNSSGASSKMSVVNIKDRAGNVNKIMCTVKNINLGPTALAIEEYINEKGYNCIRPYTCYKQGDYGSSRYSYCSTDTCGPISEKGCSITSVTTIVSGFDIKSKQGILYTPYTMLTDVYNKVCSSYCSGNTASKRAFNYVGLSISGKSYYYLNNSNLEIIFNHMRQGYPALLRVGKGWYTDGGHLMALLAFKEPNLVYLYDPGHKRGTVNGNGHAVNTFVPITDVIKGCGSSCWVQLVKDK